MARRGRPPTLSRDRVLTAAVEQADRDGLSGLTMRAVADRLGVEAMSLYHYLPGKDGLLDGLVERVMAEVDEAFVTTPTTGRPDWRVIVRDRCLTARQVMVRHPWAPGLIGSRSTIPSTVYAHYETVLATMVDAGFSYSLGHRAMHALGSMVLGFVQELFVPTAGGEDLSEQELLRLAEQLPYTIAMVSAEMHDHDGDVLGWCDSQAEFEFTLDLLLDGLEARRTSIATSG
ncbi:MAG TPA: TetR/AcrR family transcriptional regulator C-terminal domain-containing protein [Microlunatus sp.]|jgi:AcrR family transcriptional regulator|nr:TetR/AcrR family transcriptional regulator C-terminal domain-containing protein [Microlunatus sp.]